MVIIWGDDVGYTNIRAYSRRAFYGENLDLAPDGKRFAVFMEQDQGTEENPRAQVTFLFHFFDEPRRRLPAAGAR